MAVGESAVLEVRVIPRGKRAGVDGERAGAVLIRLAAPPVDGAANAALIEFLSGALGVPRRDISIIAGERSRSKRVNITGLDIDTVRSRLLQ